MIRNVRHRRFLQTRLFLTYKCDDSSPRLDDEASSDGGCAIGMRWLSIIDLNTGHQPISNEDQSLRVFNGEIYNYRDSARIYQPAVTILLLKRV